MKKIVIKSIIFVIWVVVLNAILNSIDASTGNMLAMSQMSNSFDSTMWIQIYSTLKNYTIIIYGLFFYLIFKKDIKQTTTKIKEKMNNEKEI